MAHKDIATETFLTDRMTPRNLYTIIAIIMRMTHKYFLMETIMKEKNDSQRFSDWNRYKIEKNSQIFSDGY